MPVQITILLYIIIFLYGIVIGSFLNVCIYRIPEKESIMPRSHCMNCGATLHWYDMFPVFSYIILRGRCRNCGAKISKQYPLIEALNGILYVIVFMANGININSVLYCLMTSVLIVLTMIDERTFEIPLCLNITLAVIGVVMCVIDRQDIISHLVGMVCVSLVLFIIYFLSGGQAIGGGDVKLMAAAGLILGWKLIILAFLLACILGSVIHLIRMKVSGAKHILAMGPYLSLGIFIAALWGNGMIDWYVNILCR
ncbi:prepilin peptidase [Eubacterium sp. MSJ-13]|uniref:prepilin peptidase n=1 Tax=Eubacterium sp. MSJ-13 TaxID=2841513 RepID=UPI001C110F76|nr:A24 family peptidase [Eubacterium sp. MSJ-13]MBU5478533.1 prepilin peptidase [Eubacterium sp. MSJ-13]